MRKILVSACFRIFELFFYKHFKELPQFKALVAADIPPALPEVSKHKAEASGSSSPDDGNHKDIDFTNPEELSKALFGSGFLAHLEQDDITGELVSALETAVQQLEDSTEAQKTIKALGDNFVYNPETKMATVFATGRD